MEENDQVFAAVDLGSNSFHMIVMKDDHGQLRVLDKIREPVRLGAGLDKNNRLSDEAKERALFCLEKFGQRLRDFHPNNVRIVGTNTLRKARNSASLLRKAEEALGHPVEIISGIEEARLIYLGVSHSMADEGGKKLVVDIGGGSTELIIGEHFESQMLESLYMGCVSMTREFFSGGEITKSAFGKAQVAAKLELESIVSRYKKVGWSEAVGASGTARSIAKVVMEEGWSEQGITYKSLKKLRKAMINAGSIDNLQLKGLGDDRRPVFVGGAAILISVFEALGIEEMQAAEGALREGLIYDMQGRLQHEDVRERTIDSMLRRYHVDNEHAERVVETAASLFRQVAGEWHFKGLHECSQMLEWSARLHEIGLDIAHNGYHKHGAYLVENSDMLGFSKSLQKRLAFLIRGHRRKFPVLMLDEFPEEIQQSLKQICILLRIAVKLNHGRSIEQVPNVRLEVTGSGLKIFFPKAWLESHPLTEEDMRREASYLEAADFKLEIL